MPFEYVRAQLQSQNVSDSGIFENILEVQIRRFNDAITEARLNKYTVILSAEIKLVIAIEIVPSDVHRQYYVAMSIDISYDSADNIWGKITSNAYDSHGNLYEETGNSNRYLLILAEVPWTVPRIVSLDTIRRYGHRILVDETFTFAVSAFFQMHSPDIPYTLHTRSVRAKLKELIHNAAFGDNAFVVGGVAFFVNRSTLIRHYEHFEAIFRYFESRDEIPYELPETYPQTFEEVVIDCYQIDMKLPSRDPNETLHHLNVLIREYERQANILAST